VQHLVSINPGALRNVRIVQDPASINPYARVHGQTPSYNPTVTTQLANGVNGKGTNCNRLATNTKGPPAQEPLRKTPRARPLAQDPVRKNPFLKRCSEICDMCREACLLRILPVLPCLASPVVPCTVPLVIKQLFSLASPGAPCPVITSTISHSLPLSCPALPLPLSCPALPGFF
jgi:hypothetical protein